MTDDDITVTDHIVEISNLWHELTIAIAKAAAGGLCVKIDEGMRGKSDIRDRHLVFYGSIESGNLFEGRTVPHQ